MDSIRLRSCKGILCLYAIMAVFAVRFARAGGKEKLPKMVVMDLKAERGLDPGLVKLLNELLLTELQKVGRWQVIGGSDIAGMLKLSEQKQMLGCNDIGCLVDLGGALGADKLVATNIGKIGNFYLVNVKIIDIARATVDRRVSYRVRGVEDALMKAITNSVDRLAYGKDAKGAETPSDVSLERVASTAPGGRASTMNTLGHALFWSGCGAIALGFAGLGISYKAARDYEGGDVGAKSTSQTWSRVMWAGFGVGGAAVAAGVILWLLEPESAGESETALVPATDGTGAMLTFTGRW